jgi:hypothetical protein
MRHETVNAPDRISAPDRHLAAVARSLQWAQESAERGDYTDALAWVSAVEATGSQLPPGYHAKRQAWLDALSSDQRHKAPPAP